MLRSKRAFEKLVETLPDEDLKISVARKATFNQTVSNLFFFNLTVESNLHNFSRLQL